MELDDAQTQMQERLPGEKIRLLSCHGMGNGDSPILRIIQDLWMPLPRTCPRAASVGTVVVLTDCSHRKKKIMELDDTQTQMQERLPGRRLDCSHAIAWAMVTCLSCES